MCASPTSASDRGDNPINLLWRISRLPGSDYRGVHHPGASEDLRSPGGALQQAVTSAVTQHLAARGHLAHGEHAAAREAAIFALENWYRVAAEIAAGDPPLVSRAHAFHARLASRHRAAYRTFARKQLLDLASCARLKTEALLAAVAAAEGDLRSAAASLDGISRAWRAGLPVRLPGLCAIELAASAWYGAVGDAVRAEEVAARAATISGVLSAYPEDAPAVWPEPLGQVDLLRFSFAAARLPEAVDSIAKED